MRILSKSQKNANRMKIVKQSYDFGRKTRAPELLLAFGWLGKGLFLQPGAAGPQNRFHEKVAWIPHKITVLHVKQHCGQAACILSLPQLSGIHGFRGPGFRVAGFRVQGCRIQVRPLTARYGQVYGH